MNPLPINANGMRFSPTVLAMLETIRSAPPLSMRHFPMIEAIAINKAILVIVLPSPSAMRIPQFLWDSFRAASSWVEWTIPSLGRTEILESRISICTGTPSATLQPRPISDWPERWVSKDPFHWPLRMSILPSVGFLLSMILSSYTDTTPTV